MHLFFFPLRRCGQLFSTVSSIKKSTITTVARNGDFIIWRCAYHFWQQ